MIEQLAALVAIVAAFVTSIYLAGFSSGKKSDAVDKLDELEDAKRIEDIVTDMDADARRDELRQQSK